MQVYDLEKFLQTISPEQKRLDLSHHQLTVLPDSLGNLSQLEILILGNNQLTSLPELTNLTRLKQLDLSSNKFCQLPETVFTLSNLQDLDVSSNHLTSATESISTLPLLECLNLSDNEISEIGSISSFRQLKRLQLHGNSLRYLPTDIGELKSLTELQLGGNKLEELPVTLCNLKKLTLLAVDSNDLGELPESFGALTELRVLDISATMIDKIPGVNKLCNLEELYVHQGYAELLLSELRKPFGLKKLVLSNCKLTELPAYIRFLTNLEHLDISNNQLKNLPAHIDHLTSLRVLDVSSNRLTSVPAGITHLSSLRKLDLSENRLKILPTDMDGLAGLESLSLQFNELRELPTSLGQLSNLWQLSLIGNSDLVYPAPEIVRQGVGAIMVFLNSSPRGGMKRWTSKLLVVGEGGVGKSCTLRSIKGEDFVPQDTTHGIDLSTIEIQHPKEDTMMELNTWDFGGQEIYHATHQFFLTNKSLFLLVWNARHGYEAGKLDYWLKTIVANAPESPIIVLATHTDQRIAELPQRRLKNEFPQIEAFCEISNSTGAGIEALRNKLASVAVELPLMGQPWPTTWLNAAELVKSQAEKYTYPANIKNMMASSGLEAHEIPVLTQWLHELGEILFFHDNPTLKDLVILKPRWVSEYISRILDSDLVASANGVLTRDCMEELWNDLEPHLRFHFLNLMERFDLSYRILEDQEISLVVERLPLESPNYEELWSAVVQRPQNQKISMKFVLSDILPGIPTWFIARQHRFSIGLHWRRGVLFADGPERKHLGLVRLERDQQTNGYYLDLAVIGPVPIAFFSLLRDGIDLTLDRYPGLRVTRFLPCPDPGKSGCNGQLEYDSLIYAYTAKNKQSVQCHGCWSDLQIASLLFGLHSATQEDVLRKLDKFQNQTKEEFQSLRELSQRNFVTTLRREQSEIESFCPSVFVILPDDRHALNQDLELNRVILQLYCEAPGCWHSTDETGRYTIDTPRKWLKAVAPYLKGLVRLVKYATPLVRPVVGIELPAGITPQQTSEFTLMEQIISKIPDLPDFADTSIETKQDLHALQYSGAPLRALYEFLIDKDKAQVWGGLQKILTPEGEFLWLCSDHAKQYSGKHTRLWDANA